jgi:hypothetical protein
MKLRYASTLDELKWWIIWAILRLHWRLRTCSYSCQHVRIMELGHLKRGWLSNYPAALRDYFDACLPVLYWFYNKNGTGSLKFEMLSIATTRSLNVRTIGSNLWFSQHRQGLSGTSFTLHDFDGREQRAFRDMPPNEWASRPWNVQLFWVFGL